MKAYIIGLKLNFLGKIKAIQNIKHIFKNVELIL